MTYIDLTMPLNQKTPVYPGDPEVKVDVAAQLDKDGYLDHVLHVGTHNGTHIDAPAHMVKDGKLLNQFSVDHFIGPAKLIDARDGFNTSAVEQADIKADDIVLFYTGTSENYNSPTYYRDHQVVTPEVAEALVAHKVKMVGIDTGSIDMEPFEVHKKLLSNDVLIIENLVGLKDLLSKSFMVYALPLNLDVEGSPARVVAVVD